MVWCDKSIWRFTQGTQQREVADRHRAWLKEPILFENVMFLLSPAVLPRWDIPGVTRTGLALAALVCGADRHEHLRNQCPLHNRHGHRACFPHGTHTTHILAWERLFKHVLVHLKNHLLWKINQMYNLFQNM